MADRPFKVIDGTPAPDTPAEGKRRRLRAIRAKQPELLSCPRCSSIAMLQVKIGMAMQNGKPVGGQRQTVCASCLARGEMVVVVI